MIDNNLSKNEDNVLRALLFLNSIDEKDKYKYVSYGRDFNEIMISTTELSATEIDNAMKSLEYKGYIKISFNLHENKFSFKIEPAGERYLYVLLMYKYIGKKAYKIY